MAALSALARSEFDARDRRYGFPPRTYPKCVVGSEAVARLIELGVAADEGDAVRVGNLLLQAGVFRHVLNKHAFRNEYLFYLFTADADHGEVGRRPDGFEVKGEGGILQRRNREHRIGTEGNSRATRITFMNPVKHGLVSCVGWPYSLIHRYVAMVLVTAD